MKSLNHSLTLTVLVLLLLQQVEGFFDPTLTVVSRWGRLVDQETTSISCMSAHLPLEYIQFDRVINTGQDSALPSNKIIGIDHDGLSKSLVIPLSPDDKDRRFGVFSCYVTVDNITTRVMTLKQASSEKAEVVPRHAYVRTSVNKSVTLQMLRSSSRSGSRLIWRHQGEKQTRGFDRLRFAIPAAKQQDAGIYELFYEQRRKFGNHGILRLIVRACPPDKFGYLCEFSCPLCLNGGICHELYGICICPPGFAGQHCERACGHNHFGPTCSWRCDASTDVLGTGCLHHLICLPDPYGCSCVSGFMGEDCLDRCPGGRFGADCQQVCRCRDRASICDAVTGFCHDGCEEGWTGESCQQPALGAVQELHYRQSNTPDQVTIIWKEPKVIHGMPIYLITWRLLQESACGHRVNDAISEQIITQDRMVILKDLLLFSVYEVSVLPNTSSIVGELSTISIATGEGVPVKAPSEVQVVGIAAQELVFSWAPIPCSDMNGRLLGFEAELWMLHGVGHSNTNDVLSSSNRQIPPSLPMRLETTGRKATFPNLQPYFYYAFRVRGLTVQGSGPWSEGITALTEFLTPPMPQLLLLDRTARTISVAVTMPDLPPGIIQQVRLRGWQDDLEEAAMNVSKDLAVTPNMEVVFNASATHNIHNYTFSKLLPFSLYMIQGQIATSNGWSNWSSFVTVWTDETYPSVPSISLLDSSPDMIIIKVQRPNPTNGIIVSYRLRVAGPRLPGSTPSVPIILSPEDAPAINYSVINLLPATRYHIQVQASTSIGWGNWSEPYEFWTEEGAPGPPASIYLKPNNFSSLIVEWTPPEITNGKLVSYEVSCNPMSSMDTEITIQNISNFSHLVNSHIQSVTINGLQPLTHYRIRVRARTRLHRGQKLDTFYTTEMQSPIPPEYFPEKATDTAIPLHFYRLNNVALNTSLYQVIVEDSTNEEPVVEGYLHNFTIAAAEGIHYYIGFEMDGSNIPDKGLNFYMGDDRVYGQYWNAPLQRDKSYYFYLRVVLFAGDKNYTSISERTSIPANVSSLYTAQVVQHGCHFYDSQCIWFPFVVVGCIILIIWTVSAIVICKCLSKRGHKIPAEKGSSSSIAWSVAYRKGYGTHSEVSTLVKDQAV